MKFTALYGKHTSTSCGATFFIIFSQDDGKGDKGNGDGDGEKRFDGSGYDKDLVEALERDILQKNPNVHWYVFKKRKLMHL